MEAFFAGAYIFNDEAVRQLEEKYQIDGQWKLCLPGEAPCGGRCGVVDPRMPYLQDADRRGGGECVAQCSRTREWACDGNCIRKVR